MESVTEISVSTRPKQARSRARRRALIEYGADLLNLHDLDEISIAEITGSLGYSTGSFYSYFPDKEAYFIAIQQWVNEELDAAFEDTFTDSKIGHAALPDRLRTCLDFTLDYFRSHTGVIRSALRYERRIPEGWVPNRKRTQQIVDAATRNLSKRDRQKLETALQLAYGLMVNALLHDPGPLKLKDKKLGPSILEALAPYLVGPEPTGSGSIGDVT